MDRLDLLEVISNAFPRLVPAIVVAALLICPNLVSSAVISMAKERGKEVAAELDRILVPRHERGPDRDHAYGSTVARLHARVSD